MYYPLIQEIEYQDPLCIFSYFSKQNGIVFLDSTLQNASSGRYSFIAMDPFAILMSKNGKMECSGESFYGDPFLWLMEQLALYPGQCHPDLPPFQGGIVGYFAYDLLHHLETVPLHRIDDLSFYDMAVGFYDLVIAFDHVVKRAWIFSSGYPLKEKTHRNDRAKKRLQWLFHEIQSIPTLSSLSKSMISFDAIQSNFTSDSYQKAVKTVIHYIEEGDIFEANISQRFKANLPHSFSPFDLYRRLRILNPALFSAYLHFYDTVIASASPERFLKVSGKNVETCPIKGTRPRGKTKSEDERFASDLLKSEKDHAENVMIVDLLRNDLSRVCLPHSVHVPQLCALQSYATVHHLVSIVTGKLKDQHHAMDLLRAAFPGGSITGAPKIRSMEIIAEIEPHVRGPYCGSIGYIGWNGDMDSSIVIRTYAIKHSTVTFHAGGAVVSDSDPFEEYEETLAKASALKRALSDDFTD